MLVDPADLRFTQDSISLYFQHPHGDFSVRDAVRSISENEMTADDFPLIRVISHDGFLWSIDNRRLWVFRYARCKTISVRLQNRMHPRLSAIISNPFLFRIMRGADFFPKVRDRGEKDGGFDLLYPQPSSFQRFRKSHCSVVTLAKDDAELDDQDAEPDEFFGYLRKTQDQAWASSRLVTGRPLFRAEVQEVVSNRTGKGHTNGHYTDCPGAQWLGQPLESHADAKSDFFGELRKTQDQVWASSRLVTRRPLFPAEVQEVGPNRTGKGHTNGDHTDRPGAQSSLVQPLESHADAESDFFQALRKTQSSEAEFDKVFPNRSCKGHTKGDSTDLSGAQPPLVQPSEIHDNMIYVGQEQQEKEYKCMTDIRHIISSCTEGEQTDDEIPSETNLAEIPSTTMVQVNVNNKAMSATASPQTSPISTAQEHGSKENTCTASAPSLSTTLAEDQALYGAPILQKISNDSHYLCQSDTTRIVNVWNNLVWSPVWSTTMRIMTVGGTALEQGRLLISAVCTKILTLASEVWEQTLQVIRKIFDASSFVKARASVFISAAATKILDLAGSRPSEL